MLNRIHEARKNESGFTLIELLIVIVILGVLAGITVFGISAFNKDGQDAACKTDGKTVQVASEAFYAKTGAYAADVAALVTGGYMKSAPTSTKYAIAYAPGVGGAAPTITGTLTGGGACYSG